MTLSALVPRQPTQRDLDDCDRQIAVWRRRQRQAPEGSPWEAACAGIADEWLDLRNELVKALDVCRPSTERPPAAGWT